MVYFALGITVGIIIGVVLVSQAESSLTTDRCKAGYFEHKGKAYRVQEVENGEA